MMGTRSRTLTFSDIGCEVEGWAVTELAESRENAEDGPITHPVSLAGRAHVILISPDGTRHDLGVCPWPEPQ